MDAYFDASCLAALALRDAGWEATRDWMVDTQPEFQLSDFCWGEVVSAVGNRYRSRSIELGRAADAVASIAALVVGWERHQVTSSDIADATGMVAEFALALRLPDAIHLAVARRTGATIITLDHGQAKAAAALDVSCLDPSRLKELP